ncbi:MAG: NAD-dependent DNA ligase LigA, partial [Aeriscardovia sp.]|nr:NAD-dependent DNA ligase LigA [Aeriscardovia sp.]
ALAIFGYFEAAKDPESFEGRIFTSWIRAGLGGSKEREMASGPLSGLTFVITGTLEGMSRSEAGEEIEKAGGRVSSSVSSKTSYLLAGQKPGSKLAKAEELGVKIIGKEEFEKLLRGQSGKVDKNQA